MQEKGDNIYLFQQYRLIPYLAAGYVLRIFSTKLFEVQYQFSIDSLLGNNKELLPDLGTELHGVSSASKPISGWTMKDAIQECRETCGGHGYLKGKRSILYIGGGLKHNYIK